MGRNVYIALRMRMSGRILMAVKEEVLARLKEVIDPELGINIVDLGLIYEVKVEKAKLGTGGGKQETGQHVEVKMTLTTIGCPLAGFLASEVEEKVKSMKGVKDVHVHVVWEPPWKPEMMSEGAKKALGIQ